MRRMSSTQVRFRQIEVEWRFAVDVHDDLAVARSKSAAELVNLWIWIPLLDADFVLSRRHFRNLEAAVRLAAGNACGVGHVADNVGDQGDLQGSGGANSDCLATF